jgi:DNA-binding CsgD family transcriptional regulator
MLITSAAYLYWFCVKEVNDFQGISIDASRAHVKLSNFTAFACLCCGLIFAFVIQNLFELFGFTTAPLILSLGIVLGSTVTAIISIARKDHFLTFMNSRRLAFPFFIAAILLFMLTQSTYILILSSSLIIVGFTILDLSNWATLTVLASRYKVQPVYHFSRGKAPFLVGIALSWISGSIFSYVGITLDDLFNNNWFLALLIMLLAISTAVSPFNKDTLVSNLETEKLRSHPLWSKDIKGGSWIRTCKMIGEDFRLTKREQEVFQLLAKGKNAGTIEKALVVSSSTTKSHIYHIYKKLGISSQQDLIEIVESYLEAQQPLREKNVGDDIRQGADS